MTDIVERLRELVASIHQLGARPGGEPIDVMTEAAEEIERLRTENAEMRLALDAPTKEELDLRAEIERLRNGRRPEDIEAYPYSEIDMDMHVEAVTEDLRAEIERLRGLLADAADEARGPRMDVT